jgi:hypothetical protein
MQYVLGATVAADRPDGPPGAGERLPALASLITSAIASGAL